MAGHCPASALLTLPQLSQHLVASTTCCQRCYCCCCCGCVNHRDKQCFYCCCCLRGLPGATVDSPRARGCVPGPDAVLLPGPDADDRRDEPTLFTKPAIGPPPPLLPPAQHKRRHKQPTVCQCQKHAMGWTCEIGLVRTHITRQLVCDLITAWRCAVTGFQRSTHCYAPARHKGPTRRSPDS